MIENDWVVITIVIFGIFSKYHKSRYVLEHYIYQGGINYE
jgi:hypothetical protein